MNHSRSSKRYRSISLTCVFAYGLSSLYSASALSGGKTAAEVRQCFKAAAEEFQLPESLLLAIAEVESHGFHNVPETHGSHSHGSSSQEDSHATSNSANPELSVHADSYGIMGLRNDSVLGNTLIEAAALTRTEPENVIHDVCANIRGAAAVLAKHKKYDFGLGSADYVPALLHYWNLSSMTQAKDALDELMHFAKNGNADGFAFEADSKLFYQLDQAISLHKSTEERDFASRNGQDVNGIINDSTKQIIPVARGGGDGYPGADWDPSPNVGGGITPLYVLIHTTEGSFNGAVSWLKNRSSGVSAHYVVRNRDGYVKQLVSHRQRAFHAKCWNQYSIAIEMEGFVKQGNYSQSLYRSVGGIVSFVARSFRIPINNMHVVGHDFWKTARFKQSKHLKACNNHHDPGPHFNWNTLFSFAK